MPDNKGKHIHKGHPLRGPRMLFIIGSLDIGGAEKQMAVLLYHLKTVGHSCQVFALQSEGALADYLGDLGIPVYSGGLKKRDVSRAPWKLISAQWKLIRLIQRLRPDVVHSFLPLATFMGALGGRLTQTPLIITGRRALGTHQERFRILRPIDLMANRLSHSVTVNSRAVWEDVVRRDRINPDKLVLIYNGVDAAPYETASCKKEYLRKKMGAAASDKIITVIANLIPYKGHSDFLQAACLVADRMPSAVFWLVGEDRGIQRNLEKMSMELGIYERVKFMGRRNDIPEILAASDLSVLPSHEEGFSNVILESMAAGLPVVASRVGGNPEAVVDGVTGRLFTAKDPAAMAEQIIDILSDLEKARLYGERGRERVRRLFSIEKMVEAHLNLYKSQRGNMRGHS